MGRLYSSVLLALAVVHAGALPTPNATGIVIGWVEGPTTRGTFGILLSCLSTFGLCAWTAVHVNVVPRNWFDVLPINPHWFTILCSKIVDRLWSYKLWWMLMAIFFPEIVLSAAFNQWLFASALHKWWCAHFDIQHSSDDDLTMVGAFFVVMGGFTINSGKPAFGTHHTLTPQGFIELIKSGDIKRKVVQKRVIEDKGKADFLAKLLVCVQVSWMIIQSVARKLTDLPVTLLEIHVIMHALCAVAMYGFWFHKPLDVKEQIPLTNDKELGKMLSFIHGRHGLSLEIYPLPEEHLSSSSEPTLDPETDTKVPKTPKTPRRKVTRAKQPAVKPRHIKPPIRTLRTGALPGSNRRTTEKPDDGSIILSYKETFRIKDQYSITLVVPGTITLAPGDLKTLRSVVAAVRKGKAREYPWEDKLLRIEYKHDVTKRMIAMTNRAYNSNPVGRGIDRSKSELLRLRLLLSVIIFIYGGFHACAWNSHFPTPAERLLWRVSCLLIGVFAVFRAAANVASRFIPQVLMRWSDNPNTGLLLTSFMLLIFSCRIFLSVEAFISLRSLPAASYQTVEWGRFWPH